MKIFRPDEFRRFLVAVDQFLAEPFDLIVIGGAAAALAYGYDEGTTDLDTWTAKFRRIEKALEQAREATGLAIPVEHAAVADAPYEFESRLVVVPRLDLEHLTVKVPEKHDLALMKLLRGYAKDLQAIRAIHAGRGLAFETLISRYLGEMKHVVGDPRRNDWKFLAVVEQIFPDRLSEAERRLRQHRRNK